MSALTTPTLAQYQTNTGSTSILSFLFRSQVIMDQSSLGLFTGNYHAWHTLHNSCLQIPHKKVNFLFLKPYNAEIFLYKPWRPKGYFHFEIIINASSHATLATPEVDGLAVSSLAAGEMHKRLSSKKLFPAYSNTYVMGLRP